MLRFKLSDNKQNKVRLLKLNLPEQEFGTR